jgi:thiamine pyrophosphokinase
MVDDASDTAADVTARPSGVRPRVVLLAGGDALPPALDADIAAAMDQAEFTVAADGGIRHAHRVDRDPHVLVGDLDSTTASELERAASAGTEVQRHPVDKDATDLELALDLILERTSPTPPVDAHATGSQAPQIDVLIVGGHGGRTDHLLANLLVLSAERYASLRFTAWWGSDVLHVVRNTATLHGRIGSTVSLLATHGPARGVTTEGLHFALSDAELTLGSSLGVSNRLATSPAHVRVTEGVLIVLHSPPVDAPIDPPVTPSVTERE